MNIYEVLHEEHVQILGLLERAGRATSKGERRSLLDLLIDELSAHTIAEQEILYRQLNDARAARATLLEAIEEHLTIARLMAELVVIDVEHERCDWQIKVLTNSLAHHVAEEECELFFQAQRVIDDDFADALPRAFRNAKDAAQWMPIEDRLTEALAASYLAADDDLEELDSEVDGIVELDPGDEIDRAAGDQHGELPAGS
ncbi:MAG: hemerythrin domain-containing protein [Deltaproteobacteria bacterium]|nr:hemerythrin domain-containing protein [Deltaproteobacteria bacterium]